MLTIVKIYSVYCCDQIGHIVQMYNQMVLLSTIPLSFVRPDLCQVLVIKISLC